MAATRNKMKLLCLLSTLLLLIVCTACNSASKTEQGSTATVASTEPTTQPTTEPTAEATLTSTAPTASITEPAEPPTEGRIFDSTELPACDNEVLADNASIPLVIRLREDGDSVVAYRGTWDITNGALSEKTPCFSYSQDVMFLLDYWDGASLFWAEGADAATALGDYVLEKTPSEISLAGGGRCRYQYKNETLCLLQETGELLLLPAAASPNAQDFGIPVLMNEPLYAHYNGEKILLVYHGFAEHCLDILYTWYEPESSEAVAWKHLTIQTEYAAVSGTNFQACYCDGLLYIPSYNDLYVVDMETEEVFRVADIDRYVALVPELAENPWTDCVKIKGCYEDIVIASLTLRAADGSAQYHELAIRQGRIIGSYSRIIAANKERTLHLLDENGETLYSDDTLAAQNAIPTFPRVD